MYTATYLKSGQTSVVIEVHYYPDFTKMSDILSKDELPPAQTVEPTVKSIKLIPIRKSKERGVELSQPDIAELLGFIKNIPPVVYSPEDLVDMYCY